MFTAMILCAAILKIIFHHLPWLANLLPESCVLIVVGILSAMIINYVILDDLIKLEDGSKSFHSRNPKLIHIAKFRAIWSKIESFLRCQKHAYQQSHMNQRGAWARRLIKSSSSSPRSSSAATKTSGSAGGNANRTNAMGELAFTIRCWLYPPPPEMELYKCARQILAKESDNLVRTLDYLGL